MQAAASSPHLGFSGAGERLSGVIMGQAGKPKDDAGYAFAKLYQLAFAVARRESKVQGVQFRASVLRPSLSVTPKG